MANRQAASQSRRWPGQSLVELAMALPFLLLLFAAAADVVGAFVVYIQLGNAAREGAHYGSLSAGNATNTAGIQQAVLNELQGNRLLGVTPTVTSSTGTETVNNTTFTYVQVTVQGTYQPLIKWPKLPFLPSAGPTGYPMQRVVKMRVIPS
jgi:Flp pilus assembly protein TadG